MRSNYIDMEEISLSLVETNKLRAQIGLPLIPEPGKEKKPPVPTKSDNSELTVKETNKLRAALGLRLIEPEPEQLPKAPQEVETPKKSPKIEYPSSDTFYDTVSDDWFDRVGKTKPEEQEKRQEPVNTENHEVSLGYKAKELSNVQDGEVFTLEDRGILEDGEEDQLENEQLKKEAKKRRDEEEKKKINRLKYGLLGEESENDENEEENVQSVGGFFNDKEAKPEKPFMKLLKKRDKKDKLKKRKRSEEDTIGDTGPMKTVSLAVEDDYDEQAEIEKALARARERKQKKRQKFSAEDLEAEEWLHEHQDLREGVVFDGSRDFLANIGEPPREVEAGAGQDLDPHAGETSSQAPEPKIEPTPVPNEQKSQDQPEEPEQQPVGLSLAATLSHLRKNQEIPQQSEQQRLAQKKQEEMLKEAELKKIKIRVEERKLAEELAKDDSYGELSEEEKQKVYDRMLGERLQKAGILGKSSAANYNPQVSLGYTDEKGNKLGQKEAFKQLSHKYHGTKANQRKRVYRGPRSSGEKVV